MPLSGTQIVVSRDSVGQSDGGYHIEILVDGPVLVSNETDTGTQSFGNGPGFAAPGDSIKLSYTWDQGGAAQIDNATSGKDYSGDVPNKVGMDMERLNQPWMVGAGQLIAGILERRRSAPCWHCRDLFGVRYRGQCG